VGRIGGENDVANTDRQATGASDEATMVCEQNYLEGDCVPVVARRKGLRPIRMMRTLSSVARLNEATARK